MSASGGGGGQWQDLALLTRGGEPESRHRGAWVLVDAAGQRLDGRGDPALGVWARSAVKPFQALPLVALGLLERYGLGDEHLAIIAGSHSGEPRHRRLVAEILAAGGLDERDLACGYHRPFDRASAREQVATGAPDSPLYHNCSGKHAGMLLLAQALGGERGAYLDPTGPGQRMIAATLAAFAGGQAPAVGIDGCSAPSFHLPLAALAQAAARLAAGDAPPGLPQPALPWSAALERLRGALAAHPELVGGSHRRFDTDLMRAAGGALFAKSGAEGVELVALRTRGWGLAVKIADGAERPVPPLVCALLARWAILDAKALAALANWRDAEQINAAGKRTGALIILPEALPAGVPPQPGVTGD
jgi:L-asparaginase II